jgi:hypothetical protein
MAKGGRDLPAWTEQAGGRQAWQKWFNGKVNSCLQRASKWDKKRGGSPHNVPKREDWREAVLSAIEASGGVGHYSKLKLSLASPRKNTDWDWPSVEHVVDPGTAKLALETRLINDMKSIMSEVEFREVIGHLAATLSVSVGVRGNLTCARRFAVDQPADEPPLPE